MFISAVTWIRTWVVSSTTRSTNHHTITAIPSAVLHQPWQHIISFRLFNFFKTTPYKYITTFFFAKVADLPHQRLMFISSVTRIRTWVVSATTRNTNHYTITAIASAVLHQPWQQSSVLDFSIILRQLHIYIKQLFFCKSTCFADERLMFISAVTRIRTWVVSATTRSTNHHTITAIPSAVLHQPWQHIISFRLFIFFKTTPYKYITTFIFAKVAALPHQRLNFISAVTRIRTLVVSSSVLDSWIILGQLGMNIYQHFLLQK